MKAIALNMGLTPASYSFPYSINTDFLTIWDMKNGGSVYNSHSLASLSKTFSYIPCGISKTTSPVHWLISIRPLSRELFAGNHSWLCHWLLQCAVPRLNFHLPHSRRNVISRYGSKYCSAAPIISQRQYFIPYIPIFSIHFTSSVSSQNSLLTFFNHFQETAHSFSRLGEYDTNNLFTEILNQNSILLGTENYFNWIFE